MNYLAFIRREFGFLSFGFLMTALGTFGQTLFIALYANDIRAEFALSVTEFSIFYAVATLASAILLLYTGKLFDSIKLARYSFVVLVGLGGAALAMGYAQNTLLLIIAFFLLRHFGQGLATHTGITAVARAYDANRGRAVAVAQLGYSCAEGILPAIALILTLSMGWQGGWQVIGLVILCVALPLNVWLTRFAPTNADISVTHDTVGLAHSSIDERAFTRAQVLRDMRFYLVAPLYLLSPFVFTGLFLNQVLVFESRGWTLGALASSFSLYAGVKFIFSLIGGVLIDKYRAYNVQIFSALPLLLTFSVLAFPTAFGGLDTFAPYFYMGLCGLSLGLIAPTGGSLWAEFYGTAHLGAIRSMTAMLVICATALAPLIFGIAFDAGVNFRMMGFYAMLATCIAAVLAFIARRITLREKYINKGANL